MENVFSPPIGLERWTLTGIAKLVIISGNCPPLRKSELEYYAMLAKVATLPLILTDTNLDKCSSLYGKQVASPLDSVMNGLTDVLVRSSGLLVVNCSEWVCCRFKMAEIQILFPLNRNMHGVQI
jgi:hypothetical protein